MSNSNRITPQIERILIVVGDQNAGKSTTLRSMFVDPRLGSKGVVPATAPRRIRLVALSRERCLFFRLTSPHETGQNVMQFLSRLDHARRRAARIGFRRLNVACAMQPFAANAMPNIVSVCREVRQKLDPERMRVVVIDPRQDGEPGPELSPLDIDHLRQIEADVIWIDGSRGLTQYPNGLVLADFFDFT